MPLIGDPARDVTDGPWQLVGSSTGWLAKRKAARQRGEEFTGCGAADGEKTSSYLLQRRS